MRVSNQSESRETSPAGQGISGVDALTRAARRNAILARTARALAGATSREAVYHTIADILRGELQADGFAIYDANPRLRTIRLDYQGGAGLVDGSRIASIFYQTILGEVLVEATPRYLTDIGSADSSTDPDTVALVAAGVRSVALLPLALDGDPRGLLTVRFLGTRPFDADDREILESVATQVALTYRNLNHVAELQRRADRLAAMTRAMQQLSHVSSEEALPAAIADAVREVIPHETCDVLAKTPSGLERVHLSRNGVAQPQPPRGGAEELSLAHDTLRSGVSRLAIRMFPDWSAAGRSQRMAELCAAVRYGNRTAGVLRLTSSVSDAFDLQDLDMLTILARQAGSALETSRLFTLQEFQRQRAEGAAELARVTLQARNTADGATELLRVLDRFVPSIGKAIGVARGRDGAMEFVATSGTLDILRGQRSSGTRQLSGLSPEGRSRDLASIREIAGPELAATLPDEWGFIVPLAARQRTLGVLLVTAPRAIPLRRRDRVTLERLSTSLALALEALLLDEDERQSREREHLLATALTTIDHPIFILDRVGVRYANPAAAREYGWSQVELMDMQFEQLVVGVDPSRGRRATDAVPDGGVSLVQHVHRRRDDSEFPATVTVSPLLSQDGDVLGQVVSVRNVIGERRMEEQLRHTEKMIAVGELVAGVAHEINNPLTGISAFAQMLLEEELVGDQRESVQLIKQECDRAKAVIHDLLIFSRKTEPRIGPVDLRDLIDQTLRLRAYPLRSAGIRVALFNDEDVPRVSGDVQKLQQVLINLISNAEHAMADSAERILTIHTTRQADFVVVTVSDTGRGMPPEVRRRAFEPFFTSKPAGVGTGLGLSVSYGIVQAHGGSITVQSEAGVGTTVAVSLPVPTPMAAKQLTSADVGPDAQLSESRSSPPDRE